MNIFALSLTGQEIYYSDFLNVVKQFLNAVFSKNYSFYE